MFFDDYRNEGSALGKQLDPKPGVHNSEWVQDPAGSLRSNTVKLYSELESYEKDNIAAFKDNERVLMKD
jgi:hypothetical protein